MSFTFRDAALARQRHEEQLRDALQRQAVRRALEDAGVCAPAAPITMRSFARLMFWFVGLNALAGAASLLLFPGHTDSLFFWTITPPLNAALFGALYLAGGAVTSYLAWRGDWEAARVLIPVLVTAGLLISGVTLVHLDRFTPDLRLAYWLAVYLGAPLLALIVYLRQERRAANWTPTMPLAPAVRRLAVLSGALLLGVGTYLLLWPHASAAAWPWPITPLMLRIFAAWFSAFGVGLLWFLVDNDWTRLALLPRLLIVAAGIDLLVLLFYRADLSTTGPRLWLYIAHMAGMILLGILLHWLQRISMVHAPDAGTPFSSMLSVKRGV
jgi:hypothetical protein